MHILTHKQFEPKDNSIYYLHLQYGITEYAEIRKKSFKCSLSTHLKSGASYNKLVKMLIVNTAKFNQKL